MILLKDDLAKRQINELTGLFMLGSVHDFVKCADATPISFFLR